MTSNELASVNPECSDVDPSDGVSLRAIILGPVSFACEGFWPYFWVGALFETIGVALMAQSHGLVGLILIGFLRICAVRIHRQPAVSDDSAHRNLHANIGLTRVVIFVAYIGAALLMFLTYAGYLKAEGALVQFPASDDLYNASATAINTAVAWIGDVFGPIFTVITRGLSMLLGALARVMMTMPWPVMVFVVSLIAWRNGGWRRALLCAGALVYLGVFGLWEKAMDTSSLVLAAVVICTIIGVPMGIATAKSRVIRSFVIPLLDFMQTMPSFVYLLPAVAFFSLGKPPALVATIIFSIPPLIRLTALGIDQVPGYVKEAMYAHGASRKQTLFKAELPLAMPSIKAGINQTVMLSLAMVVIAALIGGGGLGYDVLFALQNVQYGRGILAGIAIVVVAIVFDRVLSGTTKKNGK